MDSRVRGNDGRLAKAKMDSRIRGNDGKLVNAKMDSRLRGNDDKVRDRINRVEAHGRIHASKELQGSKREKIPGQGGCEERAHVPHLPLEPGRRPESARRRIRSRSRRVRPDGAGRADQD